MDSRVTPYMQDLFIANMEFLHVTEGPLERTLENMEEPPLMMWKNPCGEGRIPVEQETLQARRKGGSSVD